MKIFIPYRPSRGGMTSIGGPAIQQQDFSFVYEKQESGVFRHPDEDIHRCMKSIAKNSRYKHEIIVCTDGDIQFQDNWLHHLNTGLDITIFKAKDYATYAPHARHQEALKQATLSHAEDGEFICWDIICDAIVGKNWDVQVMNCINQHGDSYYYTPIFVEPRDEFTRVQLNEISSEKTKDHIRRSRQQTTDLIWNDWRKTICCHSLTMLPKHERDYALEADFDEFIQIASQYHRDTIIENAGCREYGYWAPIVSTGKRLKDLLRDMNCEPGKDLWLDNSFTVQKMVLCRSFVLHMHYKIILDNIEVEHVK